MPALLLPACGGGEDRSQGEDRTTAVLRARTEGLTHLQRDRLEEAESRFRRLAELAPEESAGPANLALVQLRRGEAAEAEDQARRALRRAPDDPWIHLILAKALELQGEADSARAEREEALELDPGNLRALWALAGGSSEQSGTTPSDSGRAELLARLVERAPSNIAARLELADARLAAGEADAAAAQLEELRSLIPDFPPGAAAPFERALSRARAGDPDGARRPARRFHEVMRVTPRYQAGLEELRGPRGELTGVPSLSFSHEVSLEVPEEGAVLDALRFADATEVAGLHATGGGDGAGEARSGPRAAGAVGGPAAALGDFDGDGDLDLYAGSPARGQGGRGRLLRNDGGRFVDATPAAVREVGGVRAATFADYDADGRPDLYLTREGTNRLFRNLGEGRFGGVTRRAGVGGPGGPGASTFADLDHDGDLDLVAAAGDGLGLYRNDGDGSFTAVPDAMGLAGGEARVRDVDFADFDDDADLDLVAARGRDGLELLANLRQNRFLSVADSVGLGDAPRAEAVAVGDYDNDGHPDLFVTGREGTAAYRNLGDGRFERDRRSASVLPGPGVPGAGVAFLDFDNDGHLDVALGGRAEGRGLVLLHNRGDGSFEDLSRLLLSDPPAVLRLDVFDYNRDGDRDFLASTRRGLRLLRNDGGDVNHHFDLRLVARGPGSGKVNRFGIGSKVEVRAGDLYQSRTVRGPVTHFGLGSRLKADVVRIVWTNGVPQYLYYPRSDADLVQEQQLKGSCAFVYAWDGEGYGFVTDAMWRSALGMPVGIMAGGRSGAAPSRRRYAPPAASREYVRIPPERLEPRRGRYRLQITEELWEVAYVDEVKLLAVDHPESVEVFVDEKFVPPSPPELRLYRVRERLLPVSARDGEGDDLLRALRAGDDRYVSDLEAGPYQGIVETHELVLELPPRAAEAERPFLFLQGWIFPTDASINVAASQSDSVEVSPPRLEVPDGDGGWRPVDAEVGFPSGKAKTVVVDLGGLVPPEDPRVRIRTNMQIYWDHAFFAAGSVAGPVVEGGAEAAAARLRRLRPRRARRRVRLLRPASADLHRRGFSREYRKGGRHGPHWFDYDRVSRESPWLPIPGRYTRYGDVLPLLGEADDMYVVMAPGDEMTVEFQAESVPAVPSGWTRTFLLYTDGWIKDADLNTATGGTVGPLPHHAQPRYPYGPDGSYPRDPAHRDYLERYQTREVSGSSLRLAPAP